MVTKQPFSKKQKAHLGCAHAYWRSIVMPGDTVIDATCGNGHDTLYLAKLLQGHGRLICYDIQKQAIHNTRQRLALLSAEEKRIIEFKHLSHKNFFEKEACLIVYNLGFLPGFDKTITTLVDITLLSIQEALKIATKAISIMCYPGHAEGKLEEIVLLEFFSKMNADLWSICYHRWLNRPNGPSLIWLERLS